jgi:hypothetical protein
VCLVGGKLLAAALGYYSWVTSSVVVPGPKERFPFEGLLAFWRDPSERLAAERARGGTGATGTVRAPRRAG